MRLGHAIRHEWRLDRDWLSLNHGSFGAAPLAVLAAQEEWRRRMEAQPGRFFRRELGPALREAADRLGAFVNAAGRDLAFVPNATTGCNAVLRSFPLQPGDEVLVLDHGYAAVRNAARYAAERAGARVVTATLPFPCPTDDAVREAIAAALTDRTRLAVIDHITSPSALMLPVAEIVADCHAAGVKVLIDGAHAPGQVPLELGAIGADWYAGNCHKWLCAPKGCGFLWAAPDAQEGLHPVTISHGFGKGFLEEFDWTGTSDPSAFLSVTAALDFHQRLGGEALMARNAALAHEAAHLTAARLGTEIDHGNQPGTAMALVRLCGAGGPEAADTIRDALMNYRIDAPVHAIDGVAWLRLSAFAYNEIEDYAAIADAVSAR